MLPVAPGETGRRADGRTRAADHQGAEAPRRRRDRGDEHDREADRRRGCAAQDPGVPRRCAIERASSGPTLSAWMIPRDACPVVA